MVEDLRPFGDPGSDRFRVNSYPFYLLNRAASRYNTVIESHLRPIGLDIPTWRVLMILGERDPLPIARVARKAVINLSTMMRIVERMAKAGLVETHASITDGRVTELTLTKQGHTQLMAARQAAAPIYQRIIQDFSADEFTQLLELLGRLHKSLEP